MHMCKLGMISQERLKIKVKLLLSANRKSYMPRQLAQQRMTLSDLEWPFHASCAIYELLVHVRGYNYRQFVTSRTPYKQRTGFIVKMRYYLRNYSDFAVDLLYQALLSDVVNEVIKTECE